MKERPILMTPENAQKCHEGTKTQTRRVLKRQPWEGMGSIDGPAFYHPTEVDKKTGQEYPGKEVFGVYDADGEWGCVCQFGRPGDRLWVRESIYIDHFDYVKGPLPKEKPSLDDGMLIYRGEGTCCEQFGECDCGGAGAPWRPSLYMPRWACRTVLEITEVRVERLQEISEEDAIAEGVTCLGGVNGTYDRDDFSGCWTNYSNTETAAYWNSPIDSYHSLWDSINGVGSWALNPWVWVIEFRRSQS